MEYIYLLRNNANGKVYVGRTGKFDDRKKMHINELRLNRHSNKMLQDDYNKYGEDVFSFEIVFKTEMHLTRTNLEQAFMVALRTYDDRYGYNRKDPYFFNNGKPTKNYKEITIPGPSLRKSRYFVAFCYLLRVIL